jgi:hypothetical protein
MMSRLPRYEPYVLVGFIKPIGLISDDGYGEGIGVGVRRYDTFKRLYPARGKGRPL